MSELRVALTDVPPLDRLNPYQSNNLYIHSVIWPIYEPLFDVEGDTKTLKYRPRLGTADDWKPKTLEYVFKLNNVNFCPGDTGYGGDTQFTAQSVVENLERLMSTSSFRGRILQGLIKHVTPKDADRVSIELKYRKPELLFLALMTLQPERELRFGTGPFYLSPAPHSDLGYELKKNTKYRPTATLEKITFKVIRDPAELVAKFNAGEVDFIRDIDRDRYPDRAGVTFPNVNPFGVHYLGFNVAGSPFNAAEVRRAFRDMLSLKEIASAAELNPAAGPIPRGVEGYDPELGAPRQARDVAKAVLQNACAKSKIALLYNRNSYHGNALARRIQMDLGSELVEPTSYESSSELLAEINRRRDKVDRSGHNGDSKEQSYAFVYNWYSILPAAEIFLRPLFEKGMPDNLTGYDGIEDLLPATQDPEKSEEGRVELYKGVQRRIVADAPAVFLGHSNVRYSAVGAGVTGLKLNVQSFPVERYVGVDVRPRPCSGERPCVV